MFIVLMTSFHKLKDKHLQLVPGGGGGGGGHTARAPPPP